MGGWACEKFPEGINIANRTTQTYGKYFDFAAPQNFEIGSPFKKNLKMFASNVFFLC